MHRNPAGERANSLGGDDWRNDFAKATGRISTGRAQEMQKQLPADSGVPEQPEEDKTPANGAHAKSDHGTTELGTTDPEMKFRANRPRFGKWTRSCSSGYNLHSEGRIFQVLTMLNVAGETKQTPPATCKETEKGRVLAKGSPRRTRIARIEEESWQLTPFAE